MQFVDRKSGMATGL